MTAIVAQVAASTPGGDVALCWFVVSLMAVILGVGWRFRTRAALWASIGVGLAVGVPLGIQTGIALAHADPASLPPAPVFRIAVAVWLALLVVAFHRDQVFRRQRKAELAEWVELHGTLYDHKWLLSLLQSRAGTDGARVSTPAEGSSVTPEQASEPHHS